MRTVTATVFTGLAALALSTFAAPAPAHADPLIGAPLGAFDGACDKGNLVANLPLAATQIESLDH